MIRSKAANFDYRSGWDHVFGRKRKHDKECVCRHCIADVEDLPPIFRRMRYLAEGWRRDG